jgi:hypothetical protein
MEDQKSIASSPSQDGPSREELEQHLRARAWKDDTFRQELLANPQAVLQRDFAAWFPDGTIPSELSIKVVEEEEQSICFVLPPRAPDALYDIEALEEGELSALSGGGLPNLATHFYTCNPCTLICSITISPCRRVPSVL